MKRFFTLSLLFSLLVGCGGFSTGEESPLTGTGTETGIPASSTDARKTRGTSATQDEYAFVQNRRLGRGVNLGNALEAQREGEWGVVLQEEYFRLIKEAGFNTVRIPIRWSAHAMIQAPYTIAPEFFKRVDWAADQAIRQGLAVIINIHHYNEIMAAPDQHKERFLALWSQIAVHYQSYPDNLYFELLNEPNDKLGSALVWNDLSAQGIQVVRQSNPRRIIIVGPGNWNSIDALNELRLPRQDRSLIVTVHYYLPFQFTHQGAEWVEGAGAWKGRTWEGSPSQKAEIARDFDRVQRWSEENKRPIFVGEFGAYSQADMDSRARWTDFLARSGEQRGFSWAYWEFCAGFGVYDRSAQSWVDPLRKALLPSF